MVFLEFVSEIYVKMDECEDIIIMSAANVIIERTEFEIKTPTLFTVIMSSVFKILNVFIDVMHYIFLYSGTFDLHLQNLT